MIVHNNVIGLTGLRVAAALHLSIIVDTPFLLHPEFGLQLQCAALQLVQSKLIDLPPQVESCATPRQMHPWPVGQCALPTKRGRRLGPVRASGQKNGSTSYCECTTLSDPMREAVLLPCTTTQCDKSTAKDCV